MAIVKIPTPLRALTENKTEIQINGKTIIEVIDNYLRLKIVSGMKSKIAGKVLSQLNVKVEKRTSGTFAGKRVKDVEIINVQMAAEDKSKGC